MKATVVGSGPNGLAAALVLADAGADVTVLEAADRLGGGTRSSELTLPGLLHDECSAAHPLALDTPFSRKFDLGVKWRWAEVEYSHPLDGGRGAAVHRSVEATAAGLATDAPRYRRMFGAPAERFDAIASEIVQPVFHVPRHPLAMAGFGARSALPAGLLARAFATEEARALWAGVAAHSFRPFSAPISSAVGVALGAAAHRYGWPVAEGGSRAITDGMVALLRSYGAKLETEVRVRALDELDRPDITMLDLSAGAAADVCGDQLPARYAKPLRAFSQAPGVFKVEWAVEGGVPWTHEDSRRAGTVHVGGSLAEIADAERDVNRGRMPARPFVIVCQQALADPGRADGELQPVYSYAHVPFRYTGDATAAIRAQIERFAPGFSARVRGQHVRSATTMERYDANLVGGDVTGGANSAAQLVMRPRPALDPYWLGTGCVYLCSASTPPGAGAHGMCGFNAAQAALKRYGRSGDGAARR